MKRMCCFNLLGGLALSLMTFIVWWHWEWVVSSSEESGSTILRNLGLVYGGLIAIWIAVWRGVVADRQAEASKRQAQSSLEQAKAAQDQAETSQRGLLNERCQKGAEMLGSPVLAVRLGGIYALQSLNEDEPEQYHVQIMRLFCTFVRYPTEDENFKPQSRDTSGKSNIKNVQLRADVQAVMTAIGSRSNADVELEKKKVYFLDLMGVDLTYANLIGANLTSVFLSLADLTNATLYSATLTGTVLHDAKGLTQAQLAQARADPANPPKLDSAFDAKTGKLLEWRDKPCRK